MNNKTISFAQKTLENEYAVIYAYGIISARTTHSPYAHVANHALEEHQKIRDYLIHYLLAESNSFPPAQIAYTVPKINNHSTAKLTGKNAEKQSCHAYTQLIENCHKSILKTHALSWLTTAEKLLTAWTFDHNLSHMHIEAFPGLS